MYDFVRALRSSLATHPEDELKVLYTKWGEELDPENVRKEYPRPQMRRDSYTSLNGWWHCKIVNNLDVAYDKRPKAIDEKIVVPFSPEAPLSQVMKQLQPNQTLWYKLDFNAELKDKKRLLLHFEAVDFECACHINGKLAGSHAGAYVPFTFDITELVKSGSNELVLAVHDASELGQQPRGKQRLDRGTIWYTAQSGIWQPVWLEEVPETYIDHLDVNANPDTKTIHIEAEIAGVMPKSAAALAVKVNGGKVKARVEEAKPALSHHNKETQLVVAADVLVDNPHLWTPEDPFLYDLEITFAQDSVTSYCAFRIFTVEFVDDEALRLAKGDDFDALTPKEQKRARNFKRFCLNHKPIFLKGLLDQGYWPDGLLTAPADEALVFDIELAHKLGFNMVRKHIKVEPSRWYYHCDKLGMIVWQDLVNGCGQEYPINPTNKIPTTFPRIGQNMDDTKKLERFGSEDAVGRERWLSDAKDLMHHLRSFPCIATWTVFNEAWGQFFANDMLEAVKQIDDTRPFDQTSGWCDQRGGDFFSEHNYFRDLRLPKGVSKYDTRARVISEFGGFACFVPGHSVLDKAYGYDVLEDFEALRAKLNDALATVNALEAKGLSGYVYTQLTDVEEEANGLISYDRKVIKY